jgi:sulfate permease, SulP family
MNPPTRTTVTSALEGTAASVPLTLSGTMILYSLVAPDWLAHGVLAGWLGLVLCNALTAHAQRPVLFGVRFFEAATLASMVLQLAQRLPEWGAPNTNATRIAVMCAILAVAGLVVGLLWLLRAERFARFIPTPVFIGFTNSICVALVLSQPKAIWQQMQAASVALLPLLVAVAVLGTALAVRRWRPTWPAATTGLAAGMLLAFVLQRLGWPLPLLTDQLSWSLPATLADFAALTAPGVASGRIALEVLQNGFILGTLMFMSTVVVGQQLGQSDDRQGMRLRDKLLQSLALTVSGTAGAAPMAGAPTVSMAASRRAPLQPAVALWLALFSTLFYLSHALTWLPLVAVSAAMLYDAWVMWDRPSSRHLLGWLRRRPVAPNAREDLIVIGGVMAASLLVNMVAGLFAGLLLGLLLHAHRNTRQPVRQVWSGQQICSNCARSRPEQQLLSQHGSAIRVFELEASQFFASAGLLNTFVRREIGAGVEVAILDWTRVRDIDTSLAQVIVRLQLHAERQGVRLLHAGVRSGPGEIGSELSQNLPRAELYPDLDHALEAAENHLLERHRTALDGEAHPVEIATLLQGLDTDALDRVLERLSWHDFQAGDTLVRQGEHSDDIWLVIDGQASVIVPQPDGRTVRLAGVRQGTTVGEIGFLDHAPRSATVVAETRLQACRLSRAAFDGLAAEHPAIVQRLLTNMTVDLAARLRATNRRAVARQQAAD